MNSEFHMNNEFGQKRLNEFKQIWQNLNLSTQTTRFYKNSSPVTLEFDLVFYIFFYFSNILNLWTVKSSILKFGGDRIRRISVKFTEFVNLGPTAWHVGTQSCSNFFFKKMVAPDQYWDGFVHKHS